MLSGSVLMLRYARGARKLLRDRWAATSWLARAAKTFATCVLDLGNPTTKTISNVIFTKRSQTRWSTAREK